MKIPPWRLTSASFAKLTLKQKRCKWLSNVKEITVFSMSFFSDTSAAEYTKDFLTVYMSLAPLTLHMHEWSFFHYFSDLFQSEMEEKEEVIHRLRMKVKVGEVLCFITLITCFCLRLISSSMLLCLLFSSRLRYNSVFTVMQSFN